MGNFSQIINSFLSQLINIPLINPLSYLYVILNIILLLLAGFLTGGSSFFSGE